jgi:hypothetical protein
MDALIVNLFAGPGTGKSSTAAGLFSELKWRGHTAEMALEFAKDKVWEGSTAVLNNQIYIFGKQHHRIWRLRKQVEVVITDSPLLLSLIYGAENTSKQFHKLVLYEHWQLRNLNVFLERLKKYDPKGRLQTEKEAKVIDRQVQEMLEDAGESYMVLPAQPGSIKPLADRVEEILEEGI